MSDATQQEYTMQDLSEWYNMSAKLKVLKMQESKLRRGLFAFFFPQPKEGTNTHQLPDDCELKAVLPYDRKVDEALLDNYRDTMEGAGINIDKVFKFKPELSKANYNKLTDEQKEIVDEVLVVRPGSPQFTIKVPPPEE